ncbi:MAG: polymerase IV protein [Candidatus Adlerbacteria bacterium GW2011_GWC1_50_9]|uniref:DNA polymerase IV n=1 Tax=Candidatus Adlerbacteria bacterium GW2011_GWC1_50_9 TaxID=1618608 RepID=A0A0G1YTS2_9BACT|nr:MAG: polymerase IV protein [Candidatus Adlerbacteria bacterium GW2011_GWC1_50_9]
MRYNKTIMRIIAHIDMDAFFAAVEERDHEWLRGKPIVVGADPREGRGRGVVSTANYKAREYGIRSALPISKAWELSEAAKRKGLEPAVFLFTNFAEYEKTSARIMKILKTFSNVVEQASIDEAYFEIKNSKSLDRTPTAGQAEIRNPKHAWGTAAKTAKSIKEEIRKKEKLTCSIGIGPNKLIAKIASDFKKPDGLTIITEEEKELFLEPLPVRKIPGIGPKTELLLKRMNIATVRDLKGFAESELSELMGKWGKELYRKVRGIDDSPLETFYESKSIGEQETFDEDTRSPDILIVTLNEMSERILKRMEREGFSGFRTIAITVRFAGFETHTRAHTLSAASGSLGTLRFEALKLFMPFLDRRENPLNKKIRLVGLRIEKLLSQRKSTALPLDTAPRDR